MVIRALVLQSFSLYSALRLSPAEEFWPTIGATSVGVVLLVVGSVLLVLTSPLWWPPRSRSA
jgi:hypothetical protein